MKKSKKGRDNCFKCSICGKYISYSDIDKGEVIVDFTPDTEYTTEKTEMVHKSCLDTIEFKT